MDKVQEKEVLALIEKVNATGNAYDFIEEALRVAIAQLGSLHAEVAWFRVVPPDPIALERRYIGQVESVRDKLDHVIRRVHDLRKILIANAG